MLELSTEETALAADALTSYANAFRKRLWKAELTASQREATANLLEKTEALESKLLAEYERLWAAELEAGLRKVADL